MDEPNTRKHEGGLPAGEFAKRADQSAQGLAHIDRGWWANILPNSTILARASGACKLFMNLASHLMMSFAHPVVNVKPDTLPYGARLKVQGATLENICVGDPDDLLAIPATPLAPMEVQSIDPTLGSLGSVSVRLHGRFPY